MRTKCSDFRVIAVVSVELLCAQPKSLRVVNQQLDGRGCPRAEHEHRAGHGIFQQNRPAHLTEAVDPAAKIYRINRHQHPHLRGHLDHGRPRSAATTTGSAGLESFSRNVIRAPSAASSSTTASPSTGPLTRIGAFNSMNRVSAPTPVPTGSSRTALATPARLDRRPCQRPKLSCLSL